MKIANQKISLVHKTVPELREMLESLNGQSRGVSDELSITILENLIQKRCLNGDVISETRVPLHFKIINLQGSDDYIGDGDND